MFFWNLVFELGLKQDSHKLQDSFSRADARPKKSPRNQGKLWQHFKQLKLNIYNFSIFQG